MLFVGIFVTCFQEVGNIDNLVANSGDGIVVAEQIVWVFILIDVWSGIPVLSASKSLSLLSRFTILLVFGKALF